MSNTKRTIDPNYTFDYDPRPQFEAFHQRRTRWAFLRCHRRAGKTVACVHDLVIRALYTTKKNAHYGYIAPFRQQAKQIAWRYLQEATDGIAVEVRESDLQVRFPNGATIALFGSDNPNALRGKFFDGAIIDELADIRPSLIPEVLLPALADRQGWMVLVGTPKGRNNQFYEYFVQARDDPDWFCLSLKASESKILPDSELELVQKAMSESQYQQEFECSFDASLIGTYYTDLVNALDVDGHLNDEVAYDPGKQVIVTADIGYRDSTVLWFVQEYAQHYNVIDCEEGHGQPLAYYFNLLREKPYQYQTIWLPHDAKPKTFQTGRSTLEQFIDEKFPVRITPSLSVQQGIDAARKMLPHCRFNKTRCAMGIEALRSYRRKYDELNRVYQDKPLHDWASDFADSFRYMAINIKPRPMDPPSPYVAKGALPNPELSLDKLYADRDRRQGTRISRLRI